MRAKLLTIALMCLLPLLGTVPALAAGSSTSASANGNIFWYLARASGLSAYMFLWLDVCLGLGVRTHSLDTLLARWRSFDLHQFTGLVATGLISLHLLSLLGDHYIGFTLQQLLVPMQSSYRPLQVALGIVALYLLILILISSHARRFVGYGLWRKLHYLAFLVYALALAHGVLSGTDSSEWWVMWLYVCTGAVVFALAARRFLDEGEAKAGKRRADEIALRR